MNKKNADSLLQSSRWPVGKIRRRRGEEKAGADEAITRESSWPEDARQLVNELRSRQIEMAMENEGLAGAEAALEISRARYFKRYDLAPVGYLTLSEGGLILEINCTAATLFGTTKSALTKLPLTRIILPEDLALFDQTRQQLFETGAPQACELRMLSQGGAYFWARLEGTKDWDEESGAPVYRAVVSNIADRRQTEQELREKNSELERFLYATSHDLKSPLVTIKVFLGYLEQDLARSDAGSIEKDLSYLRAATDKMGRSLNDIMEMSRIGRIQNPAERVMFLELVNEAMIAVAGPIAKRGVQVDISRKPVPLFGDRLQLVQIWQNLVENAVKFMGDQAAPRVEIGVERRASETVFFVRDNGMGIDPRFQAKVFGLFQKVDAKSEGTGLGLGFVERIVALYKGTIKLESEGLGQGACFWFTLPAAIEKLREGDPS